MNTFLCCLPKSKVPLKFRSEKLKGFFEESGKIVVGHFGAFFIVIVH